MKICRACNGTSYAKELCNKCVTKRYRSSEEYKNLRKVHDKKYFSSEKGKLAVKLKNRKYRQTEKGKLSNKVTKAKRRANFRTPKWADLKKIREIYRNCPKNYHVDHIIPLNNENVCGLHVENNLQYLSAIENRAKSNKWEIS